MDPASLNFVNTCVSSFQYASGTLATTTQYCYSPDRALYAIGFLVLAVFFAAWCVHKWFK